MPDYDAVIAWVDGSDPKHMRKRAQFCEDAAIAHPNGCEMTRFTQVGEVYFAIASLLKFCPDLGTIWLVTDGQTPEGLDAFEAEGLCPPGKIRVIDHKEIFRGYERYLPTFNSLSIEALIHRIPGLSEHFIYLNDDFFVMQPLRTTEFFENGCPVIYGEAVPLHDRILKVRWRRFLRSITFRKQKDRFSTHILSSTAARVVGSLRRTVMPRHQPHPLRVSTQAQFYAQRPEVLTAQVQFRFRNRTQFQVTALAYLLELEGRPELCLRAEDVLCYLECDRGDGLAKLLARQAQRPCKFLCIQSLDRAPETTRQDVSAYLRRYFASHLPSCLQAEDGQEREDETAAVKVPA